MCVCSFFKNTKTSTNWNPLLRHQGPPCHGISTFLLLCHQTVEPSKTGFIKSNSTEAVVYPQRERCTSESLCILLWTETLLSIGPDQVNFQDTVSGLGSFKRSRYPFPLRTLLQLLGIYPFNSLQSSPDPKESLQTPAVSRTTAKLPFLLVQRLGYAQWVLLDAPCSPWGAQDSDVQKHSETQTLAVFPLVCTN